MRRAILVGGAVAVVAALVSVGLVNRPREQEAPIVPFASPPSSHPSTDAGTAPNPLRSLELDQVQQTRILELQRWIDWLDANDADGYLGEAGWPAGDEWDALAESWLAAASDARVPVTVWSAGSAWAPDYPLAVYRGAIGSGLDRAEPQAELLERASAGVNLAGLEFGVDGDFSNAAPGEAGTDWFEEPEESYRFLADRGIALVRLPIRWERVQPELFGSLDPRWTRLIERQLDAAEANGIRVVLDLHNSGRYETEGGTLLLGSDELPGAALVDLWERMSREYTGVDAVAGYDLMNEPHDLPDRDGLSGAESWEQISQSVVTALRAQGDDGLLLVGGYAYSGVQRWLEVHPDGWIDDPARNFRYEAHHYWDEDETGTYEDGDAAVDDDEAVSPQG